MEENWQSLGRIALRGMFSRDLTGDDREMPIKLNEKLRSAGRRAVKMVAAAPRLWLGRNIL